MFVPSMSNPMLKGILVLMIAGIAAILNTSAAYNEQQTLTESDIGSVARKDIPAPRDFVYREVDLAATERKRQESTEKVLPVYDYQLEAEENIVERIQIAFTAARTLLHKHQETIDKIDSQKPGDNRNDEVHLSKDAATALTEKLKTATEAMDREMGLFRIDFFKSLGQALEQRDYEFLLKENFSPDLERWLINLVNISMEQKIVENVRTLELHGDRGITLRIIRNNIGLDEITITRLAEFISLKDALGKLPELASKHLRDADSHQQELLVRIASTIITDNCNLNLNETQARREQAKNNVKELVTNTEFKKGQILVGRGHVISEKNVAVVQASTEKDGTTGSEVWEIALGIALFTILCSYVLYRYAKRNIRKFNPGGKDVLLMASWLIIMLIITRVSIIVSQALAEQWDVIPINALYFMIPVAAGTMLVRLLINAETAYFFAMLQSVLTGLLFENSLIFAIFCLITGVLGASEVKRAKERTDLVNAGVKTGLYAALMAMAGTLLLDGFLSMEILFNIVFAFIGGIFAGLLVTAVMPVAEAIFDYTTNIKLMELITRDNPLLKDLTIRAPGTYHHSIMVANLVEATAAKIHANPDLAKAGAYYHDVGKLRNPSYFGENLMSGENPHDKLKPSMSALILKDHIKDGVKLLKSHKLPKPIVDLCQQHSGTTMTGIFYEKAVKLAEENSDAAPDPQEFRYPGPKPQTREAALLMLADMVEAATRSMPDPTPSKLRGKVQQIINSRFIEGELNECDLTLRDLHEIAKSFADTLLAQFHSRPEYNTGHLSSRGGDYSKSMPAGHSSSSGSHRPSTGKSGGGSGAWSITSQIKSQSRQQQQVQGRGQASGQKFATPMATADEQDGNNGNNGNIISDKIECKVDSSPDWAEQVEETGPKGIKRLGLS